MEIERANLQAKPANVDFPVDLIRTVAIFLIILVHANNFPYNLSGTITLTASFNWWTVNTYAAIGNLGVPLFVMLSGALLLDPAICEEPMRVFFKKRFVRIGLPVIFWTIAYFAWGHYVHGYSLTPTNIFEGLISGSYPILWFMYLIMGLYLVTPFLRVVVKYVERQKFKFLLALWVVGSFFVPFVQMFIGYNYNPLLFVFAGWIGYYLLGAFLLKSEVHSRIVYLAVALGLTGVVVGDAVAVAFAGPQVLDFFHEYLIFTIITASAASFLILIAHRKNRFEGNSVVNRSLHWIGQNTLPIYLIHMMILETIWAGWLGFTLNSGSFISIFSVPLLTVIVFFLSAVIVYPLMKIPYLKRLIG